jgi:hypothetical protein
MSNDVYDIYNGTRVVFISESALYHLAKLMLIIRVKKACHLCHYIIHPFKFYKTHTTKSPTHS